MLQKWREHGVFTYAGYILGFPADTKESIVRDIEIIKRELPLDLLEFFILTPLPGSEDHKVLLQKGAWMDPDLNKYDLDHRVAHHPKMSDAEWEDAYRTAWETYYSPEHIRTILQRAAVSPRGRPRALLEMILWFYLTIRFEGVHPLESGLFRLKSRRDRRHGLPLESPFVFYPRYWAESVRKIVGYTCVYLRCSKVLREVTRSPERWTYSDLAIAPAQENEVETLELFSATTGGGTAVAHKRRADAIRAGAVVGDLPALETTPN
jgi:hypothetical protein